MSLSVVIIKFRTGSQQVLPNIANNSLVIQLRTVHIRGHLLLIWMPLRQLPRSFVLDSILVVTSWQGTPLFAGIRYAFRCLLYYASTHLTRQVTDEVAIRPLPYYQLCAVRRGRTSNLSHHI